MDKPEVHEEITSLINGCIGFIVDFINEFGSNLIIE
ncbi:hypothetical protein POX_e06227 [Penicillium oxalicum]|nr:hypothetical protein POX_e06227 [Penicillium oxalicum]KAI2788214.1 hypothetical protein POX_e06227 [Penicillium oxalicum]